MTTTVTVTPMMGGTVEVEGATLEVPPGAVPGDVEITVTSTTQQPPSTFSSWASPVYQFGPDGLVFLAPVQITLTFTGSPVSPTVMWSLPEGGYENRGGTVNGQNITTTVLHFSEGFVVPAPGPNDPDAGTWHPPTTDPDAGGPVPGDGGNPDGGPKPDGGTGDGGVPTDAGTHDGGPKPDGGIAPDGGVTSPDGGVTSPDGGPFRPDGGFDSDGGVPPPPPTDGGVLPDGDTKPDGGFDPDGGVPPPPPSDGGAPPPPPSDGGIRPDGDPTTDGGTPPLPPDADITPPKP